MGEYGQRKMETFIVASNLPTSLWEHKFVAVNSIGTLVAPADKGADVIGVLEIGGSQGQAATVTVFGLTKVRGGAASYGGQTVTSVASGFAVIATSGEFITARMLGVAASGYLAPAMVNPAGGTIIA